MAVIPISLLWLARIISPLLCCGWHTFYNIIYPRNFLSTNAGNSSSSFLAVKFVYGGGFDRTAVHREEHYLHVSFAKIKKIN
ncbi:hypothetical protein RhiirC2_749530 [Rhizophagus irregularis]|uniref:Uncharacterized protein n=1 Tax=Rhizophagus irregularis TaxID=588596 RepID=A0A2N1N4N2_9GLOM|nr:hypothetical protein RhiirC2_749530 [Rhizophagus irregularis]